MAFSYSFHISSKSHAVSTVGKVSQCSRHNLREYVSQEYDKSQIEVLAGSDGKENTILDDIKKIYHEEFDECLKNYNQGKRADRQIEDYLSHVSNSRGDVAVEIIIQVGDKNFWSDKTQNEKMQMSYIFKDQLRALEKLCPDFKIASAVLHYDESSPHMHIVGVPVATGYKKGMEKQVAKTKVFTADRLSYLQDKMRANAEKGMEMNPNLFAGAKLKDKEKGRNKDIPKESLNEYYDLQNDISNLKNQSAELEQRIQSAEQSAEIATLAYDRIAANAEQVEIPEMLVGSRKVVDQEKTIFSPEVSHREHFVHIPVESKEAGKEVKQAILDLYSKESTSKSFKEAYSEFESSIRDKSEYLLEKARKTISDAQKVLQDKDIILESAKSESNSIIAKAKENAEQLLKTTRETYKALKTNVFSLTKQNNALKDEKANLTQECNQLRSEVTDLTDSKAKMEYLKREIEDLQHSKDILTGELRHEFMKTHFVAAKPGLKKHDDLRKSGKLLALYNDGTTRKVGNGEYNPIRGDYEWDSKTLDDRSAGRCKVGFFEDEATTSIPRSLLKELIKGLDKNIVLSHSLKSFIDQQDHLEIHSSLDDVIR